MYRAWRMSPSEGRGRVNDTNDEQATKITVECVECVSQWFGLVANDKVISSQ